jgi:hypothetical protein
MYPRFVQLETRRREAQDSLIKLRLARGPRVNRPRRLRAVLTRA